jgi:hypothetical protein
MRSLHTVLLKVESYNLQELFGDYGSVGERVAPGLTAAQRALLWARFAPFDRLLQADAEEGGLRRKGGAERVVAGFQRTGGYHAEDTPRALTMADVHGSWPTPRGAVRTGRKGRPPARL